jgi:transposase
MRTTGSAEELERRRLLAVERVSEGYDSAEVAEFLGVHPASVRKWWKAYQQHGAAGLAAKPVPGRPPKLTPAREIEVIRWLHKNPKSFGFATELWTARRVAQVIERKWGVKFHPNYLSEWLSQRGISSQKPQKRARERDEQAIEYWKTHTWPRIQNARAA